VLPIPTFFRATQTEAPLRILLICPIPLEFTVCRTALVLHEAQDVLGCRTARGSVGSVDIMAIETGPAKARAASATIAGIDHFQPDLVVDTGTCGAIDGELIVRAIVLGLSCLEYDISGDGLPRRILQEMKLPSAFDFLPRREAQKLVRTLTELAKDRGLHLRAGVQACGEFFIQSAPVRESLFALSGAAACNWESAGVFVGALRACVPPLSLRVVSDLGDEDSLRDFRRNARKCAQDLYRFVRDALEAGWFSSFYEQWKTVPRGQVDKMPQRVLP
jgi:adenosylhomocysteine nucleosidase